MERRDDGSLPVLGAPAEHPRLQAPPHRVDAHDEDDEPMGGDPTCWLHLFEDAEDDTPRKQ